MKRKEGWPWLFFMLQAQYCVHKLNSEELSDTYMMPEPHLSHMGNLSALPTDDAIFVDGAFTLLNPTGLSESPSSEWEKLFLIHFKFHTPLDHLSVFQF